MGASFCFAFHIALKFVNCFLGKSLQQLKITKTNKGVLNIAYYLAYTENYSPQWVNLLFTICVTAAQ